MDLRWDDLLAVLLDPDGDDADLPATDGPDGSGEPDGARARSLAIMAATWPDRPELPALVGRMTGDVDEEVRDVAVGVVETWAGRPGPDDRILQAVAAAAGEDDDGTGARELVTALADVWRPSAERFPDMAALVALAVDEPGGADRADSAPAVAVRELAAGWRRDTRTFPLLAGVLSGHPVPAARRAALEVLVADWGDDPAVADLVRERAGADGDLAVRTEALRLVRLRYPDGTGAVDLLAGAALHDASATARAEAVRALGERPHPGADGRAALAVLEQAALDTSAEVRAAAFDVAFGWAGTVDTGWLLEPAAGDPDLIVRAAAVRAAVRHDGAGPAALQRVEGYLADAEADIRVAALRGLTRLDPARLGPLVDVVRRMAESDPWFRARQVAGQVLAAGQPAG